MATGLAPTIIHRKGQRSTKYPKRPPAQVDYWGHELPERELTTDEMNDDAVSNDLRALVDHLWDRRTQIEPVIVGAERWIETIIDSDSPRIVWACDVEVMRKLSAMNIGWVVITWSAEDDEEGKLPSLLLLRLRRLFGV
jgi:hypothetical protein